MTNNFHLLVQMPATTSETQSTDGRYTVDWSSVSGATSYRLYRSIDGGSWTYYRTTSSSAYSENTDPEVHGDHRYRYRVKACIDDGCSGYAYTSWVYVEEPPPTPTGITSPENNRTGSYTVDWNSVSSAQRYIAQEAIDGGVWHNDYEGSASQYDVAHTNGTFEYRVRACKTFACSGWSGTTQTIVYIFSDGTCDPWGSSADGSTTDGSEPAPAPEDGTQAATSSTESDVTAQAGPGC